MIKVLYKDDIYHTNIDFLEISLFQLNLLIMKSLKSLFIAGLAIGFMNCTPQEESNQAANMEATTDYAVGQSGVQDTDSEPNVVQVAVGSSDHTTLVKAVQAAGLVDALSNAGPFTVFAPTDAAFAKLPAGTVEGLLKPAKKDDLVDILQYHVYVGVLNAEYLSDGQNLGQVNGGKIKITKSNDEIIINGKARIIASIKAANGVIHVIDEVLLPE